MDLEAIVSSAVAELGYDSVKPEQKAALLAFLRGRDVFVSLPTGYAVADLGGVRGMQMHPPFCPAL